MEDKDQYRFRLEREQQQQSIETIRLTAQMTGSPDWNRLTVMLEGVEEAEQYRRLAEWREGTADEVVVFNAQADVEDQVPPDYIDLFRNEARKLRTLSLMVDAEQHGGILQ